MKPSPRAIAAWLAFCAPMEPPEKPAEKPAEENRRKGKEEGMTPPPCGRRRYR